MNPETSLRNSIHKWVTFFIVALIFSGLTAFCYRKIERFESIEESKNNNPAGNLPPDCRDY